VDHVVDASELNVFELSEVCNIEESLAADPDLGLGVPFLKVDAVFPENLLRAELSHVAEGGVCQFALEWAHVELEVVMNLRSFLQWIVGAQILAQRVEIIHIRVKITVSCVFVCQMFETLHEVVLALEEPNVENQILF